MSKRKSTISKKKSTISKRRQRVTTDSDTISYEIQDFTRKRDGFAGTLLTVEDQDGDLTQNVIALSPQRLDSINIMDSKPGSVAIEAKARKKPFMVVSMTPGLEIPHSKDGRGFRGKDVEIAVRRYFRKRGWQQLSTPSDFDKDDYVFAKAGWKRRIEVKEVNEIVKSSKGKAEKGRIQFTKQEIKDLLDWQKVNRGHAEILIKVNYADGSVRWKSATPEHIHSLIKTKDADIVKPTWNQLQELEDVKIE